MHTQMGITMVGMGTIMGMMRGGIPTVLEDMVAELIMRTDMVGAGMVV